MAKLELVENSPFPIPTVGMMTRNGRKVKAVQRCGSYDINTHSCWRTHSKPKAATVDKCRGYSVTEENNPGGPRYCGYICMF